MSDLSTASSSSMARFQRSPLSTRRACPWSWCNQAGVARGYFGIEEVQQVHEYMIAELARQCAHGDMWLFCPSTDVARIAAAADALSDAY
jgi:hypothetical protein